MNQLSIITDRERELAERLARYEFAFNEWIEKSEWVQNDEQKLFYGMLGMHRADCMRTVIEKQAERIAQLESEVARLRLFAPGQRSEHQITPAPHIGPTNFSA